MRDWNALLIHGAGGGAWEWNRWRGVFEANAIGVQAIELQPGPQGLATTSLGDYAMQVRGTLQAMRRPRLVAGASLGGLLAAMCAEDAEDAEALMLINPVPPAPWNERLPREAGRQWFPGNEMRACIPHARLCRTPTVPVRCLPSVIGAMIRA